MLIALLAVLGVNLVVIVVLLAVVLARKRWVKRQPGALTLPLHFSFGRWAAVDTLLARVLRLPQEEARPGA